MAAWAATLLLCLANAVFAADTSYRQILVEETDGAITARLPLTDVTGPARVKRMESAGVGIPIAPTRTALDGATYLEWQISYDSTEVNHWSGVPAVKFQRSGQTKYGCELTKLLVECRRLGFLTDAELRAVREELPKLAASALEEREKMTVVPDSANEGGAALPHGFARFVAKVPLFEKNSPHGRVEIQLKQKQRAVGYQAMVYACIPQARWRAGTAPRGTGPARTKETVLVRFDRESAPFLLDLVRAFGIASREHNSDLTKILDAILAL